MPFTALSADGLSIACFVVDHDWRAAAFSVSFFFGADVAAGLSGREDRTPEAEALLLSIGLRVVADTAAEAQALRHQLATVADGWVGMPLLADAFLGADRDTAGARALAPERLLDLTVPAIVASTDTLTADHTYAPLVVGHFTDLPPVEPASGTAALCSATLTEDSPWAFRVGVPAAIMAALTAGTWPEAIEPDWSTPPQQTPVHGLAFSRIGQQRERAIGGLERALAWTTQAGFTLGSRTEIAQLVGFFLLCRGQWAPFDASLWFTPGTPSAEAPNASTLRFADPVLKLDFGTTQLATAQVKMVQLPWEIAGTAGETPQRAARVYLYQFTYAVPSPVVWRFTNCWRPLTRTADGTYNPAPMEHEAIVQSLDLSGDELTLNTFLFGTAPMDNPLRLFEPPQLEGRLWLRVYELDSDPLDPDSAELVWAGTIVAAPQAANGDRKVAARGLWLAGLIERQIPNVLTGPRCNTTFLSARCGHLKATWAIAGTLSTSADTTVEVATADSSAANTFAPGRIEVGAGLTYEARSITASTPIGGGQRFTIDSPLRQAATGQAVVFLRSCDRTLGTCQALDPTGWRGRFRGHPFVPQVNLSLPQSAPATAAKK